MEHLKKNKNLLIIFGLMVLALASRLIPHPPNFTPIGAVALFGAAHLSRKYLAFIIPILAIFLSDLLLNNLIYKSMYPEIFQGFVWLSPMAGYIYGSMFAIALLGIILFKKVNLQNFVVSSLIAAVIFFLMTNLGSFFWDPIYPKTGAGLQAAYIAGLPFLLNTVLGNLIFGGVLFGIYHYYQSYTAQAQLGQA